MNLRNLPMWRARASSAKLNLKRYGAASAPGNPFGSTPTHLREITRKSLPPFEKHGNSLDRLTRAALSNMEDLRVDLRAGKRSPPSWS